MAPAPLTHIDTWFADAEIGRRGSQRRCEGVEQQRAKKGADAHAGKQQAHGRRRVPHLQIRLIREPAQQVWRTCAADSQERFS